MADRSLIEDAEPPPRREEAPEWGYEEGVEWGLIFPDANGEYQSPINLNSREAKYDPSLLEVRLSPNYVVCRDCEVINDGHSIQIALKSKSVLIGGPLPRGHEFELHDVRFHWGRENQRGSEHTVNFKAFPMELFFFLSKMFMERRAPVSKASGLSWCPSQAYVQHVLAVNLTFDMKHVISHTVIVKLFEQCLQDTLLHLDLCAPNFSDLRLQTSLFRECHLVLNVLGA
ncbi:carbonic anhydrase-related protein isoform X4 [Parus major]|uniref:carbonic anhydrase-related protein isoform X4 n=1 Tax=Parus major TaxID=9157 RepID=UPI0007715EE4|nr:carbonic anhydrase-related protein isoform X4 [Parus major]